MMKGLRSWEITQEQFAALPDDGKAFLLGFVIPYDVQGLRSAYERTGNGAHMWRAWRCLRLAGAPLPDWLLGFIDCCADKLERASSTAEVAEAIGFLHPKGGDSHGMAHADGQLDDNQDLLRRFDGELARIGSGHPTAPKSKTDIYKTLAREGYGKTPDAVKQKILRLRKDQ